VSPGTTATGFPPGILNARSIWAIRLPPRPNST
jgi:hypothetical protein